MLQVVAAGHTTLRAMEGTQQEPMIRRIIAEGSVEGLDG